MRAHGARLARESGQAMVEACVMFGVIALLFLSIWYLGKFHDLQASTIQTARYAAWERTARPFSFSDVELEKQARARLFTWNQNSFKDSDGKPKGQAWGTQSAMWDDHSGKQRLLARPDDVAVSTNTENLPGLAADAINGALQNITKAGAKITGGESLPIGEFYTGRVSVKLANVASLPTPLDALNLTLNESSSLVTNSWDANGPKQVAMRTRPFAPASAFQQAAQFLSPIRAALAMLEPSFNDFKPGQICPDIVPADRINGSVLPAYRGVQCY